LLPFKQKPNQVPTQPLPNPNNKNPQNAYMVEGQKFPTYMITPLDLNDFQLRSGRILEKDKPSIVIQEQNISEEDSLKVNKSFEGVSLQNQNIEKEKQKESINTTPSIEQPSSTSTPHFPERL